MSRYQIRVHYPAAADRLVLRTELDWEHDLVGTPTADGAMFTVESSQPWLYFKAAIRTANGLVWQPGFNRVAEPNPEGRDLYPSFFSGMDGRITKLRAIDGVRFRLYLPPGYDENSLKRYPVLYMHDGSNLFLPEEAFMGQSWEVDDTLNTLNALAAIDQVIVVAIYANDRMQDYTAPGYVPFANWCADVLRPWVDANCRTLTGPKNTAVMGSSLGGVLAMQSVWGRPDAFGMAGCLSSTFGVFDDLFERVARDPVPDLRIYLDSGWPNDNFERNVAMRDLLLRRGLESGKHLQYFVFPGAAHRESAWGTRVHIAFQWFFARSPKGI
jgi:predicted alpha/beta superfamily hydrolase